MNFYRPKLLQSITCFTFVEGRSTAVFRMIAKAKSIFYKNPTAFYILFFSLLVLSITACQTNNSLSLEEAKEVSATFENLSFRIPARTIQDVEMVKALRDWKLTDNGPRLNFYENPGPLCSTQSSQDAYEYGRLNHDHLDALMTLLPMFEQNRVKPQTPYERSLVLSWDFVDLQGLSETIGKQYERLGDIVPALKWLKISSKLGEDKNWYGTILSRQGQLLYLSALAGDLEAAGKHIQKIKNVKSSVDYYPDESGWTKFWITRGEAAYSEALGHLDEAATKYSTAISLYKTLDVQWPSQPRLAAHLAMVRMKQGRLVEAEVILISGLSFDYGSINNMPIRNSYSTLLYEQARYNDAVNMGKLSLLLINENCIPDVSSHRAMARNNLARAFMAVGRWQDARSQFDKIKQDLKTNKALYENVYAGSPDHALSLLQSGASVSALPILEIRAQRLEKLLGSEHYDTAQTKAFLAIANFKVGNLEVALKLFFENVPLIIQRSRQSEKYSEGTQSITFRKRIILESYIELLAILSGTTIEKAFGINAMSEAFKIADIARSSTVERLLAQSSARSTAHTPELSNLARREQDLQRQISAQWASLSTGVLNGVVGTSSEHNARTAINKLRSARATLMEEIEREFPGYANTINPPRMSINEAAGLLRDDERLLTVYMGEQKTFVWSITNNSASVMYVINKPRRTMDIIINNIRRGLNPDGINSIGDIPKFSVVMAHTLFKILFEKDSRNWRSTETLIYVPHGMLSTLPLAVLPMSNKSPTGSEFPLFSGYQKVDWIVNTFDIATLPSISSLNSLRKFSNREAAQLSFLGIGNPQFSKKLSNNTITKKIQGTTLRGKSRTIEFRSVPNTRDLPSAKLEDLPQLPVTGKEIYELARILDADMTRDVYLGNEASEENIKSAPLANYRIIAFATHGLISGDLDGLYQPALALSSPSVTGGIEDGLLTMDEIMALRVNADWVVLSACNTGTSDSAGAEAISGLGGAFFYAGAGAMLVSYWPVETTSSRMLTTELFRLQRNNALLIRSEALRQTYQYLIKHDGYRVNSSEIVFSYAHPIFWAAFNLIGLPTSKFEK
jgi:CHAT domain-containing protein/tetratricopeptide (TPR) repeat protein